MSNKNTFILAFMLLLLCVSGKAHAQPTLGFPVACTLGEDCWIVNYVDVDPAEGIQSDHKCGHLTYDEHKGTDFGIPDLVSMENGVNVLAAADGTVMRVRDEIEDKMPTEEEQKEMLSGNKGCGNGVFIDHGDGWQTIYCHMKKDSISVKPNQTIKKGDVLGKIGHSGVAEFPHLHLGVFFEEKTVDPFTGLGDTEGCGKLATPLWDDPAYVRYEPFNLYAAGFAGSVPDFEAIKIDSQSPKVLAPNIPAFVLWSAFYGVDEGDTIYLEIRDPSERILARRSIKQEKDRARQFYYVGKKVGDEGLSPGIYKGYVRITRTDTSGKPNFDEKTMEIEIK